MRTIITTLFFLGITIVTMAQKRGVIVNMADGVPVRDVKIYTNRNAVVTTNWRGEFVLDKPCTSVTITHPNYLSLTLNLYEMTDTIELIPKYHSLDEVVIYGRRKMMFDVKDATKDARDYYTPKMSGGFSFDLFSLFKRRGLSKEQRKKHDQIIQNY